MRANTADGKGGIQRDRQTATGSSDGSTTLPKVQSALGALERSDTTGSLRGIKEGLLAAERRNTFTDLRMPRIVKFDRQSVLADLAYIAQPGVTSRVATRTSFYTAASDSTTSLPKAASFLRLAALDSGPGAEVALGMEDEVYVEEASGFTRPLMRTVGIALLSSFQYGYNNGNMNTQAGVQRQALGIPTSGGTVADNIWALCVSVFCIGALAGCNLSGSLADKWGRKRFLLFSAAVYLAGGLLEAVCFVPAAAGTVGHGPGAAPPAPAWGRIVLLIAGRVVTGVACGGSTVVVPMYLGEVSPAHLRGMLGTAFQLTVVIAMLTAQVLGLDSVLGTTSLWPTVLGFVAIPAFIQLILGHALIESPRWHCMVGNIDEAQITLTLLRDADPEDESVIEELDVMLTATEQSSGRAGPEFAALLRPPTRYPLFIAVTLMVLQQFSGINNAFNYSSVFLKANGMADDAVVLIAILMNVGNVLITALSVYLMDKAGRRALLICSIVGMIFATALLTVALRCPGRTFTTSLSVVSVVLFVSSFGIGLGPVPWLLPAEIMPGETRAFASSVAASTNWLANFVVGQAFLGIASLLGAFAFVPFACVLICGLIFVTRVVPETKGKSLENIQRELQGY